jgi:hypothetical protein
MQVIRHNMITPNMTALQQVVHTQSLIPHSSVGVRQVVAMASVMRAPRKTGQHITTDIDFARHISKNRHPKEFYRKYCLLSYLKEHWLWHMRSFTEETRQTKAGCLFRQLVFQKQLSFSPRPWDGFSLGDRLLKCAILGWAISADHLPLLHELLAVEEGVAFNYIERASLKFWESHLNLDQRDILIKIPEGAMNCYLDLNNMKSESDCLEWLYVQILTAAQSEKFEVIQLLLKYGFTSSSWTASDISDPLSSYSSGAHGQSIISYVLAHLQLEASIHKQFDIVPLLSKNSHNIWASYERDGISFTAVDIAMDCGKTELVFSLLESGFPLSYRISTRLLKSGEFTTAVINGRKSIVKTVLQGLRPAETPGSPTEDHKLYKPTQEYSSYLDLDYSFLMGPKRDEIMSKSSYHEISQNIGLTNAVVAVAERGMANELEILFKFTVPPHCSHLYGLMMRHIAFLAALNYNFPNIIDVMLRCDSRVDDIGNYPWYLVPLSPPAFTIMRIDAIYMYATPIEYLSSGNKNIKMPDAILSKVANDFKVKRWLDD